VLALSCGRGGPNARDAAADRTHDGGAGNSASASGSTGDQAGSSSNGAAGMSGGATAISYSSACLNADCHGYKYLCASETAYKPVRTVECRGGREFSACGWDTCGSRCIDDGEPVPCPPGTRCVGDSGITPATACRPISSVAGQDGSTGGNTPTTTSSGGVGGQGMSGGAWAGSSGGSSALSSSTSGGTCTWADCYNLTYQCLDSHEGYYRLRTVDCANEKAGVCGSDTCGTRCARDGDPVLCPAGTICQLVYRGTGIPWTYPEDACQPLPDAGMTTSDARLTDARTSDVGSN
jgi:hypothetical protein